MALNLETIKKAREILRNVIKKTSLEKIERLSEKFQAQIYFKREDQQPIRSYKIRGAYVKISSLTKKEKEKGVVTASAGNHAQGVAFACFKNKVKAVIFMPISTPNQKIQRVKYFGKEFIEIRLEGENYDQSSHLAKEFAKKNQMIYISAFDDEKVIAGQGTIGFEIYEDLKDVDMVFVPIGGGGLISGIALALKSLSPKTKIIGVEPKGCPSMMTSIKNNQIIELDNIDNFVDGVAVKKVGRLNFEITKKYIDDYVIVDEGLVAKVMIDLYQNEGIITEPAGALSVAGLEKINNQIKGKKIVCIISGGNNDLFRYSEIMEKMLLWEGRKKYFIIEFYQKPGQLKKFVNQVLKQGDDIVLFEYLKKNNKEKGPALVGLEFETKESADKIYKRLKKVGFNYQEIKPGDWLYRLLV